MGLTIVRGSSPDHWGGSDKPISLAIEVLKNWRLAAVQQQVHYFV
jgi:hypothetical protein